MAHEIEHSIFNIAHVNDSGNLMFLMSQLRDQDVKLASPQCF